MRDCRRLNGASIDEAKVLGRLGHRGPDRVGSIAIGTKRACGLPAVPASEKPALRLLHSRLSIIDVSDAGAQPMRDARTGNVITFDGEIYNFRDLVGAGSAVGERPMRGRLVRLEKEMNGRVRGLGVVGEIKFGMRDAGCEVN